MKTLMKLGTVLFAAMRAVGVAASTVHDAVLDACFGKPVVAGSVGNPRMATATQVHKPTPEPAGSESAKVALQTIELPDDKLVLRASAPAQLPGVPEVAQRVHVTSVHGPGGHVYGVLWFYLYPGQAMAKAVFKVQDQELRRVLRKDRYFMEPMAYEPVAGIEPLRATALAEVRKLLSQREGSRSKRERATETRASRPSKGEFDAMRTADTPAQPQPQPQRAQAQQDAPASARHVKGDIHEGVVTVAKEVPRPGRDGGSYSSFCLTINDGTREVPLYGSELARSVEEQSITPGDRVKVVYMGKQPVDIPGKGRAFKNLYQVTREAR